MSQPSQRNKREFVLNMLENGSTDGRHPAAFFLHFGPDYRVGPAAVARHQEFFRFTDMDFVKIQYELPFPEQPVNRPDDWSRVRQLDRDFFEPHLQVVRGLVESLKPEALVVVTLYSPFMCAGNVGGRDTLTEHLNTDPEGVKPGMEAVTESLLVFVRECIRIGVDGFYHSTQGGESRRFSDPRIFRDYVKPYDLVLAREAAERCHFNILHVCDYLKETWGGYDDLTPFLDYPGTVVNSSLEIGGRVMTPTEISSLFGRPFMGGLDRKGPLATGSDEDARRAAKDALQAASERFVLGADCTVPNETKWENLRAAVSAAHGG